MRSQDWQRLRRWFHASLELAPEEREAYVAARRREDAKLGDQLHSLLRQAVDSSEGPLEKALPRPLEEPSREPPDTLLAGRYALGRRLGSGGMGVVYLAERADGEYASQVAVKLLHPGFTTADMQRRLIEERQILANLQHPFIARLLDGGRTEDGRPFLVMEYVEGEPLVHYCERRQLSPKDRLSLFIKVCAAIAFAHRHLVVHRDIKPANILVTENGEPKLLDFGIAKLLSPRQATPGAGLAASGANPLTLEYASPEQLRGEPVTTATDIYALGVLLHELLTGCLPFSLQERTLDNFVQMVCNQAPAPPSSNATSSTQPGRGPGSGSTGPSFSRSALLGDLDAIILKTLRKTASDRYRSAGELSRDLERHLSGHPVRAHPDTLAYRCRKLLSRRPWEALAMALALLGLLTLFTALLLQQREAHLQWRRAEAVVAFLKDTLRLPDVEFAAADAQILRAFPGHLRGSQITLREVLDQAARELPTLPDGLLRADLSATLGEVFRRLSLFSDAEPLLRDSLEERRRRRPKNHPDVAHSLILLAELELHRERTAQASRAFEEGQEILRRNPESRPDLNYAALSGQAKVALARNALAPATELAREASTLARELWGEDDPRLAEILLLLAEIQRQADATEQAERLARQALAAFRRAYAQPRGHPRLAAALVSIGLLAERSGSHREAMSHLREALTMRLTLYGNEHPAVADVLHALAGVARQLPLELQTAEESCEEALTIHRAVYGPASSPVAYSLNLRGILRADRGEFVAAEESHRRALAIWKQSLGGDHPLTASAHSNLARAQHGQLRFQEAAFSYEEALRIYTQAFGKEHFQVARALINLGQLKLDWRWNATGLAAEAESLLRQAEEILNDRPHHPDLAALWVNMGLAIEQQRRPAEAEAFYRRAQEKLLPRAEEQWPTLLPAWLGLGRSARDQGRYNAAIGAAEAVLELLDTVEAEPGSHHLRALGLLVDACTASAGYLRAEMTLQDLLALSEQLGSAAASAKAAERAIVLYEAWGKPEKAERYRSLSTAGPS